MRLPRVRFTVRWLMVAIALVALISALIIQSVRATRRERELALRERELQREVRLLEMELKSEQEKGLVVQSPSALAAAKLQSDLEAARATALAADARANNVVPVSGRSPDE